MASLHSLVVHDSVPGPTHKKDRLIDENQTEEKKLFLCMRIGQTSLSAKVVPLQVKSEVSMGREGEEGADSW